MAANVQSPSAAGEKKVVFLFGDEISQYPIDFKARFGIDYSQYSVQPIGIREVTRLIWHTQLSSSNGGDFFNEVFDSHPNLLYKSSLMYDSVLKAIADLRKNLSRVKKQQREINDLSFYKYRTLISDMLQIGSLTDSECLVAIFLAEKENRFLDRASRIAPALFFQPHFHDINASLSRTDAGEAHLISPVLEELQKSKLLNGFKYIKTFIPLRRFTTSFGSTARFIEKQLLDLSKNPGGVTVDDEMMGNILNRSYLRDKDSRLYHDSIIVRFEDGKLNPKATFSELAAFLDIPYTESMTYCSVDGVRDEVSEEGNAVGFDPVTVYKNYDEYCSKNESALIEYFHRDAYQYYGYDFHYYDGQPMDERRVEEMLQDYIYLNPYKRDVWAMLRTHMDIETLLGDSEEAVKARKGVDRLAKKTKENRLYNMKILLLGLRFVNKRGQPLEMMPMLQPNPDLLVQPLYH